MYLIAGHTIQLILIYYCSNECILFFIFIVIFTNTGRGFTLFFLTVIDYPNQWSSSVHCFALYKSNITH
jgi:hypothetical protein